MNSDQKIRIAVVGAGRMGELRVRAASVNPQAKVTVVVDSAIDRANRLAAKIGCRAMSDWRAAINGGDVDAVVVSVTHNLLSAIASAALRLGKHVLCEKPMARDTSEARTVAEALSASTAKAVVGFTLRHHPAIRQAHEMCRTGAIGQPLYIRGTYGHGGRPGYDKEWRMDPELGGGGELLDQGVHLIDLSRWFIPDLSCVAANIATYFWTGTSDCDPPVKNSFSTLPGQAEDNAFVVLRNAASQIAFLHASWTQWKNKFVFEVFGRDGSLTIDGLGGSYGEERLIHCVRSAHGGAPEIRQVSLTTSDVWQDEFDSFIDVIAGRSIAGPGPSASVQDGIEAIRIVESVYARSSSAIVTHA